MQLPNNQLFALNQLFEKRSSETAIITARYHLTYQEYHQEIFRVRAFLISQGLQAGNYVGLICEERLFPIYFFAIIATGGVVVPLDRREPTAYLRKKIEYLKCEFLVSDNGQGKPLGSSATKFIDLKLNQSQKIKPTEHDLQLHVGIDQPVSVVFTSGTGGAAKAVLHSLGNHIYSGMGSNDHIHLDPSDGWLLSLPVWHVSGISIIFRCLLAGAALVIKYPSKSLNLNLCSRRVTHISMVEAQLIQSIKEGHGADLSNLKAILLGGGPVSAETIHLSLQNNLSIYKSYGSTEMASQITTTILIHHQCDVLSSGMPLRYREIIIGENNEILVRGKTLCLGYLGEDRSVSSLVDDNGWYHTKDVGKLEVDGGLTVQGRLDRMFIFGGENICPEEIETAMMGLNGVGRVFVVSMRSRRFGEIPVAFVQTATQLTESIVVQLTEDLARVLPRYKIPQRIFPWPNHIDRRTKSGWRGVPALNKMDAHYFRRIIKFIV